MRGSYQRQFAAVLCVIISVFLSNTVFAQSARIDFQRDIRPILSDTCYTCHGPDDRQRQADLRLDLKDGGVFEKLDSDATPVVPGKSEQSELYRRLVSKDEDERMPPADTGKKLTAKQISLIKKWIDQGADWQDHWSFIKPKRPQPPKVKREGAVRNDIDRFILAELQRQGLKPSSQAGKTTLLRRVTFDLTGLPPTIKEIDAFLADKSPNAYERVVDRLLSSPHYGEHMTRDWLDAARYGDTHGLHLDNERSMWPYREWVIKAFNKNMPFDRFTVEQLAGDLLPNPTTEQLIATGFNRCNVTTSEGGSIKEEYRVRYAIDRVEAIGTVWMGMSIGCAVCHEHKFDPISQTEFYQLFAYYNNTADKAMDGNALLPPPSIKVPSPAQIAERKKYQDQLAAITGEIELKVRETDYVEPTDPAESKKPEPKEIVWIEDGLPAGAVGEGNDGANSWKWVSAPDQPVFSGQQASTRTATGRSQHFFTGAKPPLKIESADKLFAYVYLDPANPPKEIMLQFNDGKWEHRAYWGENHIDWGKNDSPSRRAMGKLPETGKWVRLEVEAEAVGLKNGAKLNGWAFTQFDGTVYWDKAGIVKIGAAPTHFASMKAWEQTEREKKKSSLPKNLLDVVKLDAAKRNEQQSQQLRDYFVEHAYSNSRELFQPLHKRLADTKKQNEEFEKTIPSTLVMRERTEPRDCFVLMRGQYDQPDKDQKVVPGVPAVFNDLPQDAPPNRLSLANWLIDPEQPLMARVTVNRFWQHYFGTGIVKTAEDFGSQGEWPTHPQLLDWLATEFVRTGWDVKQMQKLIVMSGTYQQSSRVTAELIAKDPENRLLARGPRFRLDAEILRDNALSVARVLDGRIGGQSVKPYQPIGLWKAVGYTNSNTANFKQDKGKDLYRRSMYTFWKRTSPPPQMSTLDAPSRESCTVRRARTNTPLQALTLMNDEQFIEAARFFAQRILREGGKENRDRLIYGFRLATARRPDAEELTVLEDLLKTHLADFRAEPKAATAFIDDTSTQPKELRKELDSRDKSKDAELAAWTMLGNLLLNLDETVTKG